jgi:co-chaperonin GroES (HSP10)
MKLLENKLNGHLIPVSPKMINKVNNIIIVAYNQESHMIGEILAGKFKGQLCVFNKHVGHNLEVNGGKVKIVNAIDILAFVTLDENEELVTHQDYPAVSESSEWIELYNTRGNGSIL